MSLTELLALMNADNCVLARGLVSASYVAQGAEALAKRQKLIKTVLSQRRLPQSGWDDATIELFIQACPHNARLRAVQTAQIHGCRRAQGFLELEGCLWSSTPPAGGAVHACIEVWP